MGARSDLRRVTVALLAVLIGASCGEPPEPGPPTSQPAASRPATSRPAGDPPLGGAGRPGAPTPTPALADYARRLPGTLGMVVHDRATGAGWRVGDPAHATWTASTVKLAFAAALLERHRTGAVRLTDGDRALMRSMLVDSSNEATDALWERFDGVSLLPQLRAAYGMTGLEVVPGYPPYWRHLRCTTADLAALMSHALSTPDSGHLAGELRAAARVQPWGVAAAPDGGHKPGWAFKPEDRPDHWVVHSVGFAGPGERYVVAVMYDLPPGLDVRAGSQAVSDVVALAFGRPVPVAVTGP